MSLSDWGWNDYFAQVFTRGGFRGAPARVISESRGVCRLVAESGEYSAVSREHAVAGDWIAFDAPRSVVTAVLPRRTKISRKQAGREAAEQVLATNVDVIYIVTGLDKDFNVSRIERFLVLATATGASPVIVLNKIDVCTDVADRLADVDAVTGGLIPVFAISALESHSVVRLHGAMEHGQTAVLLGSSGAGKSTIVNALLGQPVQRTADVREHDSRGRHATTGRNLFRLAAGWLLIDTPGIRELEPWAPAAAVAEVFNDIEQIAASCRFRDCRHAGEPGCAVARAVAAGELAERRLLNYGKLKGELRRLERMQDARAQQEEKRAMKAMHRAMRQHYRLQ
jgi:ribosome biogenesis GTPase